MSSSIAALLGNDLSAALGHAGAVGVLLTREACG